MSVTIDLYDATKRDQAKAIASATAELRAELTAVTAQRDALKEALVGIVEFLDMPESIVETAVIDIASAALEATK